MQQVIYQEITNLEAMVMVDKNEITDLYFIELYNESDYSYGNGHCPTPRDIKQTDPIKYKSPIIVRTGKLFSPFKEIEAVPGNVLEVTSNRIYLKHKWLIKKERIEYEFRDPIL